MLGGGGVDGAIHRAAGDQLSRWIRDNVPAGKFEVRCPTGDAVITPGFYLKAKHVIHTVGPMFHDSPTARNVVYAGEIAERSLLKDANPRDLLKKSITSCMKMADANDIRTMAMPAISCGVFGCTVPVFTKILHEVIRENDWKLEKLYVILFQKWEYTEFKQTWKIL